MGKLRHREYSQWQSQDGSVNSIEPGSASTTPTPHCFCPNILILLTGMIFTAAPKEGWRPH